jgi:hypothetical protein
MFCSLCVFKNLFCVLLLRFWSRHYAAELRSEMWFLVYSSLVVRLPRSNSQQCNRSKSVLLDEKQFTMIVFLYNSSQAVGLTSTSGWRNAPHVFLQCTWQKQQCHNAVVPFQEARIFVLGKKDLSQNKPFFPSTEELRTTLMSVFDQEHLRWV